MIILQRSPVIQRVEDSDHQQGNLSGQEEPNHHHQHQCRPPRVLLPLVLPEEVEAAPPPPVVLDEALPARGGDSPQSSAQQPTGQGLHLIVVGFQV